VGGGESKGNKKCKTLIKSLMEGELGGSRVIRHKTVGGVILGGEGWRGRTMNFKNARQKSHLDVGLCIEDLWSISAWGRAKLLPAEFRLGKRLFLMESSRRCGKANNEGQGGGQN